ncbi:MAG: hypothetical protein LBV68_00120 [Spirochaetaceae bacterium]|jgi:uncharacterized protein YceK|nr:hypothetical protein [Spirochaetaceae bacterium]
MSLIKTVLISLCLCLLFIGCGTKPRQNTLDKGNAMKNEAIGNMNNAMDKEYR